MSTKDRLIMAVTEYDRRQSKTRFYNPHALGIYFERVDEVCADIERGATIRQAIVAGFNDRLCDFLLKRMGETITTREESANAPIVYAPIKTV